MVKRRGRPMSRRSNSFRLESGGQTNDCMDTGPQSWKPGGTQTKEITMLDLPLEYALVEFKGNKFSGKIVPELLDLAERGIVRFVDIVFIQKEKDGSTRV